MEPMNYVEPNKNFLKEVQRLTHKNGSLLIFDETITGFRISFGSQGLSLGLLTMFHVEPTLERRKDMKLRIVREIGPSYWHETSYYTGDEKWERKDELSREITGTTHEVGEGIFVPGPKVTCWKGSVIKEFEFEEIDERTDTMPEIVRKIKNRAEVVREWADSIPTYEEVEIEI